MTRTVVLDGTLDAFRAHARALIGEGVPPEGIRWRDPLRSPRAEGAEPGLFGATDAPSPLPDRTAAVRSPALELPRAYVDALPTISCYRDESVWRALYVVAWRIARGDRGLMADPLDADVAVLQRMRKAIGRDAHKMHAFVRFRRIEDPGARGGERFIAWYRPSHLIVEREASFFRGRFPSMDWSILTPTAAPTGTGARCASPRAHRATPPRSRRTRGAVVRLLRVHLQSGAREGQRDGRGDAAEVLEHAAGDEADPGAARGRAAARGDGAELARGRGLRRALRPLRRAAGRAPRDAPELRGCELHRDGTRAVAGKGPRTPGRSSSASSQATRRSVRRPSSARRVMLDAALEAAGLRREDLYLTNAVKHFRHEPAPRGAPAAQASDDRARDALPAVARRRDILIAPHALVCLGATAARAVFGPTYRMPELRAAGDENEPLREHDPRDLPSGCDPARGGSHTRRGCARAHGADAAGDARGRRRRDHSPIARLTRTPRPTSSRRADGQRMKRPMAALR